MSEESVKYLVNTTYRKFRVKTCYCVNTKQNEVCVCLVFLNTVLSLLKSSCMETEIPTVFALIGGLVPKTTIVVFCFVDLDMSINVDRMYDRAPWVWVESLAADCDCRLSKTYLYLQ